MNPTTTSQPALPAIPFEKRNISEIQEQLRRLEQRDWWLWSMAVVVMLLLTFAVFSLSFPDLIKVDDPFFQASLNRAVRGLIGLVLIFNAYTIYQQVMVKRVAPPVFPATRGNESPADARGRISKVGADRSPYGALQPAHG